MNSVQASEEFCGRVPLNQTNLIQPHGMLLVLDKTSFNILQVSENYSNRLNWVLKASFYINLRSIRNR
jgi:light-regulated signal transduction histidine kinase (bacteriophytochrome)